MLSHGPKRFYTPHSLEFWFERLENDWADAFSAEQLEEGRRIYREGEVRELELTDKDAIIHRRIDKKDEYAVIEWPESGITVRSSSTDKELAHALAVAGLHEIEELVADEISPLPDGSRRPAGSNVLAHAPSRVSSLNSQQRPSSLGITRALILVFKTKSAGLTFQAFWADTSGKNRVPALGRESHGEGIAHVTSGERAKLIGLASYARKAHFHYDQDTGVYLLESLVEIPNFLKVTLPAWRKIFNVELDDRSEKLLKGTRVIELEAVAERRTSSGTNTDNEVGLNLRWIFRAGERMLTDTEIAVLLKRNGGPVILPNLGIVSLPADKWNSYISWNKNLDEIPSPEGLPPYIVFLVTLPLGLCYRR